MKKCPFCGEKIQNQAIKCRFCHEHLPENSDTNNRESGLTRRKDYRRIGIIALVLYLVAFSNSHVSNIGDKLREGQIIWVVTTETQFLIGLIFIIVGFVIGKNRIVRWILGAIFGLSILYAVGISWNKEQKETDRQMAILFSTTECQKSFGDGSHGDGTTKAGGRYNCYCDEGYVLNKENSKCITASESCNELYPGSISGGIKNAEGGYNCICPSKLVWNGKSTKCITLTQLCKETYGKNAYSNGRLRIDSNGAQRTDCFY